MHDVIGGSVHAQKLFSVKPLYLTNTITAAETDVFKHSDPLHKDVTNSVTHTEVHHLIFLEQHSRFWSAKPPKHTIISICFLFQASLEIKLYTFWFSKWDGYKPCINLNRQLPDYCHDKKYVLYLEIKCVLHRTVNHCTFVLVTSHLWVFSVPELKYHRSQFWTMHISCCELQLSYFEQGNAPVHNTENEVRVLWTVFDEQIIGTGLWPSYSQDLNVLWFLFTGKLETKTYKNRPHTQWRLCGLKFRIIIILQIMGGEL